MIMKRNSWHYNCARIANDGHYIHDDQLSICQYSRKVLVGASVVAVFSAIGIAVVSFILLGLYQILGTMFGFSELDGPGIMVAAIILLIVFGSIWYNVKKVFEGTEQKLMSKESNSFTAKVYKSYKEKICFSVKFDE